jgi:hypothetical protein
VKLRIVLLVAVLFASACAGDGESSLAGGDEGGGDDVIACDLVSAEQAEMIMGEPVTVTTFEGPSGEDPVGCDYETASGAIVLTQVRSGTQYQADVADYPDAVLVDDLGDEAFFTGDSAIRVAKGKWDFSASSIAGGVSDAILEEFVRVMDGQLS